MGDRVGGCCGDRSRTVKSKEFALSVARFHHAIAHNSELVARRKCESIFKVGRACGDTERRAVNECEFFAVEIWREVTGIRGNRFAVGANADDQSTWQIRRSSGPPRTGSGWRESRQGSLL